MDEDWTGGFGREICINYVKSTFSPRICRKRKIRTGKRVDANPVRKGEYLSQTKKETTRPKRGVQTLKAIKKKNRQKERKVRSAPELK